MDVSRGLLAAALAVATIVAGGCGDDDDSTSTTDARADVVDYGLKPHALAPVAAATVDGIRLDGRGKRIVRVRFALNNEEPRAVSLKGMRMVVRGPSGTTYKPLVSDRRRDPKHVFAAASLPKRATRRTTLAFRLSREDLGGAKLRFVDSVNGVGFTQRLYGRN